VLERDVARLVGRAVVGDDDVRAGERLVECGQGRGQPIRLVVGGHDHHDVGLGRRHGRLFCRAMSDVEAHITGTVWKIEVSVGDEIAEGDTVVILESMKMEMPVEAEDDGTVKEILCEEGQAVNEGDTLVVLE
jgi:acetyl-CoA carboxylase biotin carboxyl carrier protein